MRKNKKEIAWACACKKLKNMLRYNKYYNNVDIKNIKEDIKHAYFNNVIDNNNMFSYGNDKLPKNVMIFNLPVGATCGGVICEGCYALQREYYPTVRRFRGRNLLRLLLAEYDKDYCKILIEYFNIKINQHVITYKEPIFRWHEAGDIYNDFYKDFILKVVKNNKKCKFYGYTKQLSYDNIKAINDNNNNINIVASNIEIEGVLYKNFGNNEYLKELSNKIDIKICKDTITNEKLCMRACKHCLHCMNTCFYEHGHGKTHKLKKIK